VAPGAAAAALDPPADCALCPRLAAFRAANRRAAPDWHNAPVPAFGGHDAALLVVGLAPGLKGANRTGRPFTGDHAGDLLYAALVKRGLAVGDYDRRADDGLALRRCRITNAVRCVPPANKPTGAEARQCRRFLAAEIASLPRLKAVLALGRVAHDAVLAALGLKRAAFPFSHGAARDLGAGRTLVSSYHCSRYNTATGVLTPAMFDAAVVAAARAAGLVPAS
jgi:uracil-DNA glycosylase family 4